jgi:hypothetical protein
VRTVVLVLDLALLGNAVLNGTGAVLLLNTAVLVVNLHSDHAQGKLKIFIMS